MVNVQLFQPGKVDLSLQLPSAWNELTVAELHAVAKAILSPEGFNQKAYIFKELLTGRSKKQKIKLQQTVLASINPEDAVLSAYPAINFIFEDNNLTEQPYNRIKLPGLIPRTVYGPLSAFNNLTVGEYEHAFIAYNLFKQEQLPEHLAQLMAILWRPKNTPYMSVLKKTNSYRYYDADKMQPRFAKLPAWQLYTAFMWFTGCINHLVALFPKVFLKPAPAGAPQSAEIDIMAFTKSIHAAAGPKNGGRDAIRLTMVKEFLFECQEQIIQSEKQMEEFENAKRKR